MLGTLLTVVAAAFDTVFSYIYIKFVDDSIMKTMVDKQLDELEAKGMSEQEIEIASKWMDWMMKPEVMMPIGFLAFVFFGFILTLLLTIINKKTDPNQKAA